jgi:hypothetical protein
MHWQRWLKIIGSQHLEDKGVRMPKGGTLGSVPIIALQEFMQAGGFPIQFEVAYV